MTSATQSHLVILYVADPVASSTFYSRILDLQPVDVSETFALFILSPHLKLGLWRTPNVEPLANASGDRGELVFALENDAAVDHTHKEWVAQGLTILQAPTRMDFGYTFTAADPDGHRLRVYKLQVGA